MMSTFYPDAAEFQQKVVLLCRELEAIAFKAGASEADCDDPQRMFATLPLSARDGVADVLKNRLSAGNDRILALAASYLLHLAREVWDSAPSLPPSADRMRSSARN